MEEALVKILEATIESSLGAIRMEAAAYFMLDMIMAILFIIGMKGCRKRWDTKGDGDSVPPLHWFRIGYWLCFLLVCKFIVEMVEAVAAFFYPQYWALRMLL